MRAKLPAFTLMEVTIAMVLAAISIAISFTVYSLMIKAYRDHDHKQELSATYLRLDQLLHRDFERASRIVRLADELQLTDTAGVVTYRFLGDHILRDQYMIRTDTFKLANRPIQTLFEGEDIVEGDLDELHLQAFFSETFIPLKYKKLFSSEELMVIEQAHN